MALGLGAASRERADSFLQKQETLIASQNRMLDLQMEEMRKRERYELSHFRLRRFSDWAKAAFELSIGLIALALVGALSWMIWNAAHSNELVVDSFSVPPDLAAQGISGEVLAGDLVDRVTATAGLTRNSVRAARSYSNSFGDGIKLEIPETGVSLGELDRFLRARLGHDTHIGGAMVRVGPDIRLTVRVGSAGSDSIIGKASELDGLVQRAAEAVYRRTQPYRYGTLMFGRDRQDEARAVYQELTQSESVTEQAWAFAGLANLREQTSEAKLAYNRRAAQLDPGNALAVSNGASGEHSLGHWEAVLAARRAALQALSGADQGQIAAAQVPYIRGINGAELASLQGDYLEAERLTAPASTEVRGRNTPFTLSSLRASRHDLKGARATIAGVQPTFSVREPVRDAADIASTRITLAAMAGDWAGVIRERAALEPLIAAHFYLRGNHDLPTLSRVALAEAHLGRFAAAGARLRPTPADCYPCLIARAQVSELQGQHARADWWFVRAVAAGPSLPFAETEWGRALLARGKPEEAIAQFTLANQKGPHFADPLEGWGEALMAKNQSHRALAKFAEAEKYAPNWGRLHLKWGEALAYSGNKAEAAKHFARAAQLDLTPSEKAELARHP